MVEPTKPNVYPLALLVEDDKANREAKAYFLVQRGFSVISVASKTEADREINGEPTFDIVFLDVNLMEGNSRDITGIQIAVEVKKRWPDMPIIGSKTGL